MKMNPLIAILFSGLEIGLINWVRLSFKKRTNTSKRQKAGSKVP